MKFFVREESRESKALYITYKVDRPPNRQSGILPHAPDTQDQFTGPEGTGIPATLISCIILWIEQSWEMLTFLSRTADLL